MGNLKNEQFRILFLNSKNKLIADELQNEGTINHTAAYPREIIRRSLELGAAASSSSTTTQAAMQRLHALISI